jgi:hypothetical protein
MVLMDHWETSVLFVTAIPELLSPYPFVQGRRSLGRVDLRVAASGYSYSGIAMAVSENARDALERTRQCRRATVFQCFVASPDHESAVQELAVLKAQ